ncbi:unnamed protein product [marine sediment metagenome]|uniref:Uncharacterized protein n=1 Tax=marine sediment metagenome TaxID=412755 RepID=X1B2F4_9ZZZZ
MRSEEIRYLYDRTYFLGGISKHNGQKIGVTGWEEFRKGEIHSQYPAFANRAVFKDKNILKFLLSRYYHVLRPLFYFYTKPLLQL